MRFLRLFLFSFSAFQIFSVSPLLAQAGNQAFMVKPNNDIFRQINFPADYPFKSEGVTIRFGNSADRVPILDGSGYLPSANLPDSGITAGTYGDATHTLTLTLDRQGRVTAASANAITPAGIGAEVPLSFSSPLSRASNTISIANAAADGSTKGASTYAAADFNSSSGVISIDYTNGQAATGSVPGFLTAANWTTFNNKEPAITAGTTGQFLVGNKTFGNTLARDVTGNDPKIILDNLFGGTSTGSSIDFYHKNASNVRSASLRISGIAMPSNAAHGYLAITIGANGSFSGTPTLTLDVNGLMTVPTISANSLISAGSSAGNVTGIAYAANGNALRHGFWASDHLDFHIRVANTEVATYSWEQRLGLGFSTRTGIAGKLHVKGHDAAVPVAVLQGFTSQSADLLRWLNPAGTTLGAIRADGGLTLASTLIFGTDNASDIGSSSTTGRPANVYVGTSVTTPALVITGTTSSILKTNGGGTVGAAVAGDFPTLNQNTTGSAATLTTARNIGGASFNGSANITLDAIDNGIAANGLIARTAANTRAARTITGTANQVTVTNGDGVSGNPTLSVPSSAQLSIAKLTNLTGNGFVKTSGGDGTLSIDTTSYLSAISVTANNGISQSVAGGTITLGLGAITPTSVTTGAVSGSTGTFSGAVTGTTGTYSDIVNATDHTIGVNGSYAPNIIFEGDSITQLVANLTATKTVTTTNGSPTVTTAGTFTDANVGSLITGTGIPANTYIGILNSSTSIGLSSSALSNVPVNATASGSITASITPYGYNNYMGAAAGSGDENFTVPAIGTYNGLAIAPAVGQNTAVAGYTTQQLHQSPWRVSNRFRQENGMNIVVYLAGTNNLGAGETPAQVYSKIEAHCRALQRKGHRVIVVGLISRGNGAGSAPGGANAGQTWDQLVGAVNGYIRQNWAQFADRFVDWGIINSGSNEFAAGGYSNTTWYSTDQLHPTFAGERKLASYIQPAINELLTYYFQTHRNQVFVNMNKASHTNVATDGMLTLRNENPVAGQSEINFSFWNGSTYVLKENIRGEAGGVLNFGATVGHVFYAGSTGPDVYGTTGSNGPKARFAINPTESVFYDSTGAAKVFVGDSGVSLTGSAPHAWSFLYGIERDRSSIVFGTGDSDTHWTSNAYYDGAWKYASASGGAANTYMYNGDAVWRTAPGGSAGGAVTWTERMKLKNNGDFAVNRHFGSAGSAPTISAGSNAGTGASVSLGAGSTDSSGLIAVTAGTGAAAGQLVTVTFNAAYSTNYPFPVVTPASLDSRNVGPYTTSGTSSFSVWVGNAPTPTTTYYFFYNVQGQ